MKAPRLTDWVLAGTADAQDRTVYRRSPSPEPPKIPDSELSPEWRAYFDGWRGYFSDRVRDLA